MASSRPSYLLTDIPQDLRIALSVAAAEADRSLSHIVRGALSEHFGLELSTHERRYVEFFDRGRSDRMVIRAEPELFEAIKKEARESGKNMRRVILDVLTDRFLISLGS